MTGIKGLDDISGGGLPTGRCTLVCGGTGTGKTMLAMEFLYRGATQFNEPGVFMAFEETASDLSSNMHSLGFDLNALVQAKQLVIDHVTVNTEEIIEAGAYNLDALFIRLETAIHAVNAKRVVLDTVETLFSSLPNPALLRSELHRLFQWLKDKGVTAIVTAESGSSTFTREGLEEYVSDCVINLTINMENRLASRGLRIVKYRGSFHGSNEYPFVIDHDGFSLIPITAGRLDFCGSEERITTGVADLDVMFDHKGVFRGSCILISGTSGTGKSTFMTAFAHSACTRHEHTVYFSFEESPAQITRNMRSVGLDLQAFVDSGVLHIESTRASQYGLDMHLLNMQKIIQSFDAKVVIIDPITSFLNIASNDDLKRMLVKLIDFMKFKGITVMMGSLAISTEAFDSAANAISSLMDSWLLLRDIEANGERTRALFIRKSRGMSHSNKVREFVINDHGIAILDVFTGPDGVLVGDARVAGSAKRDAQAIELKDIAERERIVRDIKINVLHAQIQTIENELKLLEPAISKPV